MARKSTVISCQTDHGTLKKNPQHSCIGGHLHFDFSLSEVPPPTPPPVPRHPAPPPPPPFPPPLPPRVMYRGGMVPY